MAEEVIKGPAGIAEEIQEEFNKIIAKWLLVTAASSLIGVALLPVAVYYFKNQVL